MKKLLLTLFLLLTTFISNSQTGTWNIVNTPATNFNGGVMLLLTDGSIMCKTYTGGTYGNLWEKLTPDSTGNYSNGSWSNLAPMTSDRLYFSTEILNNGKVYVAGGEASSTGGSNQCEIYDPINNTWTSPLSIPSGIIYDGNSETLPNGKILQAIVSGGAIGNYLYDPSTNSYTLGPNSGCHDESTWLKLPDSSILFVDIASTRSERYEPNTNTWIVDAVVPISLYDTLDYETGAAFMLPNGKAIFFSGNGQTVYYTPSGNTTHGIWSAGPSIPNNMAPLDAAAAMMPNGKILVLASYQPITYSDYPDNIYFYEFDYITNTYTQIMAPSGDSSIINNAYTTNLLDLPNGQILFSLQGSKQYYVYTPYGTPVSTGKPNISSVNRITGDTCKVIGTLFTGISEGAGPGDDWQMGTNYPIIRIKSTSGNISYSRTINWNRYGSVMTGSLPDTAIFITPFTIDSNYKISVVANGISSPWVTFGTSIASNTYNNINLCKNDSVILSSGTWINKYPTLATLLGNKLTAINTGIDTVYSTSLGDTLFKIVNISPLPNTILSATPIKCNGGTTNITVSGSGGTSPYIGTGTNIVSAGTYTYNITDSKGCKSNNNITITQPSIFTVNASATKIACGANTTVVTITGSGGTAPYVGTGTRTVSAGTYTYTVTDANSCVSSTIITISQPNAPINPTSVSVCKSSNVVLTDIISGGTWHSSNTTIASINSSGVVTGINAGTANISYTANSCVVTKVVTVNALPAAISGKTTTVCVGSTINLTDATVGGTWASNNTSRATVNSSGVVKGLSAGVVTISYQKLGCSVSINVTVTTCKGKREASNDIIDTYVKIYPNPNNGSFRLTGYMSSSSNFIKVYDISGKVLYNDNINTNLIDKDIILPLKSGIYILNIYNEEDSFFIKFIVD